MTPRRRGPGMLLAMLGCGACWYDIEETQKGSIAAGGASSSSTSSSSGAGTGAATSSASGGGTGGDHPGCPAGGDCPDGSVCDARNDWCVVDSQAACGTATFVFVDQAARFRGDTCAGFEISACGSPKKQLTFQLGGSSTWTVAVTGGHSSDVSGSCNAGSLGCNTIQQLAPMTRFAAHALSACGVITIDVFPQP